jgi:hypothetical protein
MPSLEPPLGNLPISDTLHKAGALYGAVDTPWAKLVGQIAHAYGK